MKVLAEVTGARIIEKVEKSLKEFILMKNQKGRKCDLMYKTWCSCMTSVLDIDQAKLGTRCAKNCPFKKSRLEKVGKGKKVLYRLVRD